MDPNAPTERRCADCGTAMGADTKRSECRHCQNCFRPASCSHNHDQWPKEQ